jgi:hypothetical protein
VTGGTLLAPLGDGSITELSCNWALEERLARLQPTELLKERNTIIDMFITVSCQNMFEK